MNILSRDDFCRTIYELKRNDEFIDKLNDLFSEFKRDDAVYCTGLESTIVSLLETMFDDNQTNWISYWLWELNFGNDYKEGDVTEHDGTIIPLRTAEELYDFLIKNMEDNDENS